MLSALELNGFKSFADRTRLEFPAGITVVVGPNGSGKSNVVDAMKWVLGSQSVKSLRGKEMTDVIFSGSRSRRQANAAEASLVFDNSTGQLDHDAKEIQVTRRVYRSGESEYLINRQPCRLRDVRDLLASAGISTAGYSIIEQGRVDAVLQSTPKERRLIFEEAAGISRFRLKREEAARRLERVQQNLLRLGDIVEELQSRLKTVRTQAARAQKYTELSKQIQHLRTQLGLDDWRTMTLEIDRQQAAAERDEALVRELEAELAERDARVAAIDAAAEALGLAQREALAADASLRERLALCESTRSSHLARIDELEQEVVRLSHQLLTLTSRAGDSQQLVEDTARDLAASRLALTTLKQQSEETQQHFAAAEIELVAVRAQTAAAVVARDDAQREAARLRNDRQLVDAKLEAAQSALARLEEQSDPLSETRDRLAIDAKNVAAELARSTAQLTAATHDLEAAKSELAHDRSKLVATERRIAELTGRLTGATERTAVLEELEARLDGLTSGAKEVLRRARDEPDGPFRSVRGVVADLLHVDADTAPLVEIALGERSNYLVVTETKSLATILAAEPSAWPGRTTFLRLDVPNPASAVDRVDLSGEPGVMGRADEFVETDAELTPLVRRLLGRHWFVDTLPRAIQLSAGVGRGLNFVTVAGEAVFADGTLAVGPRQSVAGMLSRRSELRALRDEIDALGAEAVDARRDADRLDNHVGLRDIEVQRLTASHAELAKAHGELRLKAASVNERLHQAETRLTAITAEQAALEQQLDAILSARTTDHDRLRELESLELESQGAIDAAADRQSALDAKLAQWQRALTEQRVELARSEQRVEGLERQREQLARDHAERDRALDETRQRAAQCQTQRTALQETVATLVAEATALQSERETNAAALADWETRRQATHGQRAAALAAADDGRTQVVAVNARLQQARLRLHQSEQQRAALAERLREDYQIELAELAIAAAGSAACDLASSDSAALGQKGDAANGIAPLDRTAVEAEIRELRDRLQAGGSVNLDALAELETLESRSGGLVAQYEDLQQARQRLERIVEQINGESRELFSAVITEVRGHFQEIFRRLFAGGEADIILEDDESGDVLECGVTIIARPPGKQPRNISLLSGGERTLTCVALLLAVFKSRPSPFCVLDEVDAALDEANIDRFCGLLKEFMSSTQFIVITHSKRTMTIADTLHGVTMQESGVSKRVSVRFEDVGEDGRIRASALRNEASAAGDEPSRKAA
jgi:chromosome segregation protein